VVTSLAINELLELALRSSAYVSFPSYINLLLTFLSRQYTQ
jgi:hypothetical protein